MCRYDGDLNRNHHFHDDFHLSEEEIGRMARVLDLDERRRGNAKYRQSHKMRLLQLCRLMEEAQVRKRNKYVAIRLDKYTRSIGIEVMSKRGNVRRRKRRSRCTREMRKSEGMHWFSSARREVKAQRRLRANYRREQRRLYRQSVRCGERRQELEDPIVDDFPSTAEEEMEYKELVGATSSDVVSSTERSYLYV